MQLGEHSVGDSELDGFATTVLASPGGLSAAFATGAGMVCCSLEHEGEQLLGLRGGLRKYAEAGSSMGIPLLYPWANRLGEAGYRQEGLAVTLDPERSPLRLDSNGLPIHGVLTASPAWKVTQRSAAEHEARLAATLDFGGHEPYRAAFPFPHALDVEAVLSGLALTITTTVRATGDRAVPIAFGWHPYLSVPGAAREEWIVTLPVRSHAVLDERGIPTGATEPVEPETGPLGERELDDLYPDLDGPRPRFSVEGARRRLTVEYGDGYPVGQVYAPAGEPFICFEPMTAPTNALVTGDGLRAVEPGKTFNARFSVSVEQLPG